MNSRYLFVNQSKIFNKQIKNVIKNDVLFMIS